jgi:hypothetical protein
MDRVQENGEPPKPGIADLAPYRRLVELQKQMIELSQQHERCRREYDTLRDVVSREVARQARGRHGAVARWRAAAAKWFKGSPVTLARELFS